MPPTPRVESETRRIRTAVIGLGAMGRLHVLAVLAEGTMELVGCADPNPTTSDAVPGPIFSEPAQMLDSVSPDLVVIASPPATHAECSGLALEAGAHIICEKPLSTDLVAARAMAEAAARAESETFVNLQLRESPRRQEIKRRVLFGELGRILAIRAVGGYPGFHERSPAWYRSPASGGGALMEFGTHLIDQMLWIGGPIQRVAGVTTAAAQARGGSQEEFGAAVFQFDAGYVGELLVSTLDSAPPDRIFEVIGEDGTLRLHGEHTLSLVTSGGVSTPVEVPPLEYPSLTGDPDDSYTQPLQRLYSHVAEVLLRNGDVEPLATYADAARVQAIIDAIRDSTPSLHPVEQAGAAG